MAKNPTISVTNVSNPLSVSVSMSHGNAVSVAIIKSETNSLSVGDYVEVSMGYDGSNTKIFSGYVKIVEQEYPDGLYTATAHDVLVRAMDYFIASKNPNKPLTYYRIQAEDLVENILNEAGITNYVGGTTNFTYAWTVKAEINLIGAYEFCKQIADMLTWHLYATENGQVRFVDRKPYLMAGDSGEKTITHPSIISIAESYTDKDLRNRVVIYGAEGIFAEAKSSSPYLPAGFYKTAVLSSFIVDRQDMANQAASYNLAMWNRLTHAVNMTIEGDSSILARDIITLSEPTYLALSSSDWYVYSAEHIFNNGGYITNLDLRK